MLTFSLFTCELSEVTAQVRIFGHHNPVVNLKLFLSEVPVTKYGSGINQKCGFPKVGPHEHIPRCYTQNADCSPQWRND